MSPYQKEDYRSPVSVPLRLLRVFFGKCQDQTISVGLILDLPPGTSVARLSPSSNDSSQRL